MFRYQWLAALTAIASTAVVSGAQAAPPTVFNPILEAQNFAITQERQAVYDTPAYQAQLSVDSAASGAGLGGTRRHTVRLLEYRRQRLVRRVVRHVYGCAHRR